MGLGDGVGDGVGLGVGLGLGVGEGVVQFVGADGEVTETCEASPWAVPPWAHSWVPALKKYCVIVPVQLAAPELNTGLL